MNLSADIEQYEALKTKLREEAKKELYETIEKEKFSELSNKVKSLGCELRKLETQLERQLQVKNHYIDQNEDLNESLIKRRNENTVLKDKINQIKYLVQDTGLFIDRSTIAKIRKIVESIDLDKP